MQHHEHSLRHLHCNQNGYIGYCNCCQRILVAFGVVMFSMDYLNLMAWQQKIAFELRNFASHSCPNAKHFVVNTDCENLRLVLTWREMNQLNDLISPGILLLQIEHWI